MFELLLCSMLTVLPDYLYRRYVQGKRLGREINLYTVWFELRWGIIACLVLTVSLITLIFYYHPATQERHRDLPHRHHPARGQRPGGRGLRRRQREGRGRPAAVPARRRRAARRRWRRRGGASPRSRPRRWWRETELATADGQIAEARSALAQAQDELDVRTELRRRNPDTVATARDRAAAGGGRRPAGLARRGARQQGDAADPHRLGAAGAEGERRGRAGAGAGRARQDRWSGPAWPARSSSSRCGPATSSTR